MLKKEVEAILDEPIDLGVVEIPCKGWKRLLQFFGLARPEKRRLILTGATSSTMLRITSMMMDLVAESDHRDGDVQMYHLINANIESVCEIIALAIHNKPGSPPVWLSDAIFTQLPQRRIRLIMQDVYGRLGVEDFFGTLGLIRKITQSESDIQETTPSTPQSEE